MTRRKIIRIYSPAEIHFLAMEALQRKLDAIEAAVAERLSLSVRLRLVR